MFDGILVYLFLCSELVYASNNCFTLDISVTQNIENEGFHRELKWLVEVLSPNDNISKWYLALRLDLTSGIYVNPDELADLNRQTNLLTYIDGNINTETPAHESEGHLIYIFLFPKPDGKVFINLPIHLRYQRAQISGGYGRVVLSKPSFLVRVPHNKENICGAFETINGPCHMSSTDNCYWKNVTYQAHFEDVDLFIPIGDLDDYPLVSIVTLLLGCAGCIYVLSILSTTHL